MITGDRESMGDDLGVYSVDDEDQLSAEDTLDGDGDPLDRGYTAADRLQGSTAHGVTAWEQSNDETIDQRLRQETPDPYSAYPSEPDWTDDEDEGRVGSTRVGRIVAPDEGVGEDREAAMVAREGRATSWDSPEESAMHYVDGDEEDELTEVEWEPSDEPLRDEDE
jgi:hypothetical protein